MEIFCETSLVWFKDKNTNPFCSENVMLPIGAWLFPAKADDEFPK